MWKYIQDHPIEFGSLVVSVGALILSIPALHRARKANDASDKANRTAEHTLRHQIINDLYREYRQADMGKSVTVMWNLNPKRKDPPELVQMAYQVELQKEHEENMDGELNAHRRKVMQFYTQLAVEASYDPIFRKVLYSLWFKRDLSIIPLVLLPVDELVINRKTSMPDFSQMDAQNQRLYRLWNEAPENPLRVE